MSSGDTKETVYLNSNTKEITQTARELEVLDQRLDGLRNYIPPAPYLLTIPSKLQFHLSEYQYREEFKELETGFKLEERKLQYQTFLTRGWEETIFSVINPEEQVNGTTKSKAMASTNAGPKSAAKKISIDDYKKRSSLPGRSINGSPAADEIRSRATSNNLTSNSTGTKRNSDVLEKSKLRGPSDMPPAKKLKPSPRLGPSGSKSPPTKTKLTLPPPLSPTLPAFVERLLSKTHDVKTEKSEPPGVIKKTKPLNLPNSYKSVTQESPATKQNNNNSTTKTVPHPPKTTLNGVFGSPSISQHKLNHSSIPEAETTKATPISKDKSSSRPSVIIRLKIPQDRRKDISRLLKLPSKASHERRAIPKPNTNIKEDKKALERPFVAGKSAEKRPREEDNLDIQPESKRSKSPAYQDQIAGKKLRESTPMSREEVTTPQGVAAVGTPIPPTSASRGPRERPTTADTSNMNGRVERLEGLQALQAKYSELGRVLKKEGDKMFSPDMSPAQKNKMIASRIETTLAFILSYTIGDEVFRLKRRALRPEATWESLFGFISRTHTLVNDQPYISGLLLQLEAIALMIVWQQRSEIAEQGGSITAEKHRELKQVHEDAQRKIIRGYARLSVSDLQNEFPRTWNTKSSLPLAHTGYRMTKDNLNGEFYLPLSAISLPIEGVRAGMTILAEWCRREGVEWTAQLELS